MKKQVTNAALTFEGCTSVEVKRMNGDKSIVCDLIQEETAEDGVVTEIRREIDFIFSEGAYPCELSEGDLLILNPIQNENNSQQALPTELLP